MGSSPNTVPPDLVQGSAEETGGDRRRVLDVELVVEPVVVPVPLPVVPVEVTDVQVAIRVAVVRTAPSKPLPVECSPG